MGRPRTVTLMRCPRHPAGSVVAFGTRQTATGRHQRYRCTLPGGGQHLFEVPLDEQGAPQVRSWSPPPPCSKHPAGRVVRNGTYGVRTPQPRQRYRCFPPDDGKPHTFTPALPRHHVHEHEHGCVECEEMRGIHRGETAVARRHSWPTRIVARALSQLADAGSYADVSRQALAAAELAAQRHEALVNEGLSAEEADLVLDAEHVAADRGVTPPTVAEALAGSAQVEGEVAGDTATAEAVAEDRRRYRRSRRRAAAPAVEATTAEPVADEPPAKRKRRKSSSSAESANAWHIAADWTEAFGPVVFEPIEARLRREALSERARLDALRDAGLPLVRPQVLLLDDVPVYGRDRSGSGKSRRDDGFFLLVVAEVLWRPGPTSREDDPFALGAPTDIPELRLRLVRAMPKSNTAAWRLVLDELGYAPDFVVADAGTGIARAIEEHYRPERTTFVPSLWHVGQAVRNGLAETRGALVPLPGGGREPLPSLRAHLAELGRDRAIANLETWKRWWDELERLCVEEGVPLDKMRNRRRNYELPFAAAIRALDGQPGVPVSTGGLETLMAKRVQPMLAMRRTSFGNIERTNRLFDLLIAREHGAFIDLTDIVTLLRNDATPEGGWTVPLRDIADSRPRSGRYSSLRDNLLVTEIAESRGLA